MNRTDVVVSPERAAAPTEGDGHKLVWQSCAACSHRDYRETEICRSKCWDKRHSDSGDVYDIRNRKLKLNEIFFGHPMFVTRPYKEEGVLRVRIANGKTATIEDPPEDRPRMDFPYEEGREWWVEIDKDHIEDKKICDIRLYK